CLPASQRNSADTAGHYCHASPPDIPRPSLALSFRPQRGICRPCGLAGRSTGMPDPSLAARDDARSNSRAVRAASGPRGRGTLSKATERATTLARRRALLGPTIARRVQIDGERLDAATFHLPHREDRSPGGDSIPDNRQPAQRAEDIPADRGIVVRRHVEPEPLVELVDVRRARHDHEIRSLALGMLERLV